VGKMKKYYCIGFEQDKNNKYMWHINFTDKIKNYSMETDKYSKKQVFETEEEAIKALNGNYYIKIGY